MRGTHDLSSKDVQLASAKPMTAGDQLVVKAGSSWELVFLLSLLRGDKGRLQGLTG